MLERGRNTVLFLCTGNYYRSRYAEILFNALADKTGLAWKADSRGLALERGVHNVGPMSVSAIELLQTRGVEAVEIERLPMQVTTADLEEAQRIIALKEAEHRPLLAQRFPSWADKVEYWHIDDAPEALALIERAVLQLAARLRTELS